MFSSQCAWAASLDIATQYRSESIARHFGMSMAGISEFTHLVRQDQAQLQRTIGNIGVTSSSDSNSGSEGGSGGGEEHDWQVFSTSFKRYSEL